LNETESSVVRFSYYIILKGILTEILTSILMEILMEILIGILGEILAEMAARWRWDVDLELSQR